MGVTVRIRGKDKLFQALKKTVPEIDENLRKALAKSGDEFVAKAKGLVPVDHGDVRDSIEWQWTRNTQATSARSPAIVVTAGGGDAFYVRFVEFGTGPHAQAGLFDGAQHPGTPAQPFFYPAYRLMRKRIRSRLSRTISTALKKSGF